MTTETKIDYAALGHAQRTRTEEHSVPMTLALAAPALLARCLDLEGEVKAMRPAANSLGTEVITLRAANAEMQEVLRDVQETLGNLQWVDVGMLSGERHCPYCRGAESMGHTDRDDDPCPLDTDLRHLAALLDTEPKPRHTVERIKELRRASGFDPWIARDWPDDPSTVFCTGCGTVSAVVGGRFPPQHPNPLFPKCPGGAFRAPEEGAP